MAVEEQTDGTDQLTTFGGGARWDRIGQRLTIGGRYVIDLSFWCCHEGDPGDAEIWLTIRKQSNDDILDEAYWGEAQDLTVEHPTTQEIKVEFSPWVYVNELVYIAMEWRGAPVVNPNGWAVYGANDDPKADELVCRYKDAAWESAAAWDLRYSYHYQYDLPGMKGLGPGAMAQVLGV